MKTILTTDPEKAASVLKSGGLAAFPTETVYGLGADAFNEDALRNIFVAKQRPQDNPLIVHVANVEQIGQLSDSITPAAKKYISAFFPGPLTVVLTKAPKVSLTVTAGLDSVGVRMPRNETAAEFLKACGTPVAAPSANLSGRPSPTTWQAVFEDLDGRIDCILQGEATEIGLESTVVDCTSDVPRLLRQGAISIEQLRSIVPETEIYRVDSSGIFRSPGMKHKHYSPRARVVVVDGGIVEPADGTTAYIGITPAAARFELIKICPTIDAYASSLFEFFRECDRFDVDVIYCEAVVETGIGAALMDRLRRAARG
ncbi:MAG: L-threonylcarbamoyladenylate synthase [Acidobacteriota bacterium]